LATPTFHSAAPTNPSIDADESTPINRREEEDRDSTFQAFKQFEQEPITDTRTDD